MLTNTAHKNKLSFSLLHVEVQIEFVGKRGIYTNHWER